jgi:hypothetical protein
MWFVALFRQWRCHIGFGAAEFWRSHAFLDDRSSDTAARVWTA